MQNQTNHTATITQRRGIKAFRKNRAILGRFQLRNRLHDMQVIHADEIQQVDITVNRQADQSKREDTQTQNGNIANKANSLASPDYVAELFFTVLNDIKGQHDEKQTNGKNDTNTERYELQARFLDLYLTYFKDAKKNVKSAISKKVDDHLDSLCLRLTGCKTPLETFVAYTFYSTSWRTKYFAKDIQAAISNGISAKNYPDWVRENGAIMDRFDSAISEIFVLGLDVQAHEGKLQKAAINGLARILGTVKALYDPASDKDKQALKAHLRQKCAAQNLGKGDKRTTIFHLFSKWLRGSDRKQASSDAKILIYAHAQGQTEQTFPKWVLDIGGLNKVKEQIPKKSQKKRDQPETPETGSDSNHKEKCLTSLDAQSAPSALQKLEVGKSYDVTLVRQPNGQIDIMINE